MGASALCLVVLLAPLACSAGGQTKSAAGAGGQTGEGGAAAAAAGGQTSTGSGGSHDVAAGSGGFSSGAGGRPLPPLNDAGGAGTGVGGTVSSSDASAESRCAAGTALCDDFESAATGGPPDPVKWTVITSYSGQPSQVNKITVDGVQQARGARALHVHTETSDPVYIETKRLPIADNHFFARALAYFDVDPGARSKGHWGAFVAVGKKAGGSQDIEVRFGGQFDILVVNYSPNDALQISSTRDGFYDDGARLPVRKWTCFEVELDGKKSELRVWKDGDEITQLHVTSWGQFGHGPTPDWSPAYDRLRIGYQSWNADTPVDVWYDAVVVDTQRIGCP